MRRLRLALATLLALALLAPATAGASAYTKVLHAYQTTGTITPCQFTSAQLVSAMKGVDTYGAQYFADFTNAIQNALAERATGACAHSHPRPSSNATSALATGSGALPSGPAPATTESGVPAPIVLMAVVAALLGLLAAVGWLFRVRGWEAPWMPRWRHGWAEAGHRTGATWYEFVDWLRSERER